MTKPDTPTLTAALAAVETAWPSSYRGGSGGDGIIAYDAVVAVNALWSALRAVHSSGGTVCVVSREAVEALRKTTFEYRPSELAYEVACDWTVKILARDLAPLLQETP